MAIVNDMFNPSTTVGTVVATAQLAMQAATLGCSIASLKNTNDIKKSLSSMTTTAGANHTSTTARLNGIYNANKEIACALGIPNAQSMGQPSSAPQPPQPPQQEVLASTSKQ
jgi:hypothetical protein